MPAAAKKPMATLNGEMNKNRENATIEINGEINDEIKRLT
jgi:hypothetical protein